MSFIRRNWGIIPYLIALFFIIYIGIINVREVTVEGKCVNKFITGDKYGMPHYYINYQTPDGTYVEKVVNVNTYNNTEIGKFYNWKETHSK